MTTEAIRRGPLGAVSPITALSPALTAALGLLVLLEHVGLTRLPGNRSRPRGNCAAHLGLLYGEAQTGWMALAVASQGVGAFVVKVVVTRAGSFCTAPDERRCSGRGGAVPRAP